MKQLLIIGTILLLLTGSVSAAELRISAAASLTDALRVVAANYHQQHPDSTALLNFAPSGTLARQIVAGAPADIYISANPKWMDYLAQQNMVAAESRQPLVQNRLVFVGRPVNGVASIEELTALARIALASPKSAPAGKYAEQALTSAGIYGQLIGQQQLVFAKDVRQALLYAERGEVDGAFVYKTDALLAQQAKILFAVAQQLYPPVVYPAAMTRSGSGSVAVQKFFAYLQSDEAGQVFRKFGFGVPE